MKGWRTIIFNGLLMLTGVAELSGVIIPEQMMADINGAVLSIVGGIGVLLRIFTNTNIFTK